MTLSKTKTKMMIQNGAAPFCLTDAVPNYKISTKGQVG